MIIAVGNDKIAFSPHFFLTHIFIYNNYSKYVCDILSNYLIEINDEEISA